MWRISMRELGSATRIFLTRSLVTGVKFFGKVMRPVYTSSTILCAGMDERPRLGLSSQKPS